MCGGAEVPGPDVGVTDAVAGCEREPIRIVTDGMSSLESKDDGRADEGVTADESSELQDQDYLWWEWETNMSRKPNKEPVVLN
ncbi:hypothetical protein EYF80_011040 [Liparis tanakae]|uniref:Uncharacterized protein n=1 Tax=Liparis tanakae TaxID=230148 RepID=A0A4Z2ILD6_9TELE|nr:hypothetical protein EYF80_011040 [Liparis tanakae]